METSQWWSNDSRDLAMTSQFHRQALDFYQREATGEVWINFGSGGHFQWPFKFWIYILYGKVGPRITRTSLVCLELGANSSGSWALARGARADIRQRCAHSLGWRAFANDARIQFDLKMRALGMRAFANDAMRVFACWATNLAPWARPRRALALRAIALAIALALWARISTH